MPNQISTADVITRYLKARVPLIVVRTIESPRALDVLRGVAGTFGSMSFYWHSRTRGLFELSGQAPVIDDRSLVGALEFTASTFVNRVNTNIILSDIEDVDDDKPTARHLAELVRLADERQGSIILITAGQVWSGLSRLGMSVDLDLPDVDELEQVVTALVDDHRPFMSIDWGNGEIRQAAEILVGVTQAEAVNAVTTMLAKGALTRDDIAELSEFKDQMFGELSGIERIKVKEGEYQIGGLSTLREWLQTRRELIRADLSRSPLHPPRGVLLVGVPGCGKSLSAKAIAVEWRLPLYRLDMSAIMGMYVGQSEGRLKEALSMADRVAPCVLWVDEIEKALVDTGGDSGVTRRLIGQLLFWLQESTSKVFMVATANDVTSLPPELLRKGRFDELFFVDLPDDTDRAEIISLYFRKYLQLDPDSSLLAELVQMSEGFAGSDIESVVHDVATTMFVRGAGEVTDELVRGTFENVVPFSRTNPEEVAAIRAWGKDRALHAGRTPAGARKPVGVVGRRVVMTH